MTRRWRGILVRRVEGICLDCGAHELVSLRVAHGPLAALLAVAGMSSTGGVALASDGIPALGWPLIALGVAHYAATWWTTSLPRGADLLRRPGDSIRS